MVVDLLADVEGVWGFGHHSRRSARPLFGFQGEAVVFVRGPQH